MPDETTEGLGEFFDSIWHDTSAYVYLATMEQGQDFKQYLQKWPEQKRAVIRHVLAESARGRDVYFSPALYREKTRPTKDNTLGSWVQWVEFDKAAPKDWTEVAKSNGIPEPSIIVQSSTPDRQHAYWRLDNFEQSIEGIEDRNRALAYRLGADTSGWDVDQLLRPPHTVNYGYKNDGSRKPWYKDSFPPVEVITSADSAVEASVFNALGTPEREYLERIELKEFPSLEQVLALGKWTPEFYSVFKMTKEEASNSSAEKRSGAIMRLGYLGVENGLSDEQLYVVLDDADKRWEKYVKRSKAGRHKLLLDIIARARAKLGYLSNETMSFAGLISKADSPVEQGQIVYNFQEFLEHEVNIEWLLDGFVTQGGFVTITGAPGVGKTQLAIQLLISLALGQEKFLIWPNAGGGQKKVLFLSLEMPHAPLKLFISKMARQYPDTRTLARNVHIAPIGEPIPLETKTGQDFMNNLLSEYRPDVVLVDSLQAISGKSISDEEAAKALVNYLAKIRQRTGTTIVLIHHNRKKPADGKTVGDLSDMFGSQFLAAAMDAVLNLRALGGTQVLSVDCWKNRLAMMWPTFEVERNKNLQYDLYSGGGTTYVGPANDGPTGTGLAL